MPWPAHDSLDMLSDLQQSWLECLWIVWILQNLYTGWSLDVQQHAWCSFATVPRNRGSEFSHDQLPPGTKSPPILHRHSNATAWRPWQFEQLMYACVCECVCACMCVRMLIWINPLKGYACVNELHKFQQCFRVESSLEDTNMCIHGSHVYFTRETVTWCDRLLGLFSSCQTACATTRVLLELFFRSTRGCSTNALGTADSWTSFPIADVPFYSELLQSYLYTVTTVTSLCVARILVACVMMEVFYQSIYLKKLALFSLFEMGYLLSHFFMYVHVYVPCCLNMCIFL